jgi:hypothetical protein
MIVGRKVQELLETLMPLAPLDLAQSTCLGLKCLKWMGIMTGLRMRLSITTSRAMLGQVMLYTVMQMMRMMQMMQMTGMVDKLTSMVLIWMDMRTMAMTMVLGLTLKMARPVQRCRQTMGADMAADKAADKAAARKMEKMVRVHQRHPQDQRDRTRVKRQGG